MYLYESQCALFLKRRYVTGDDAEHITRLNSFRFTNGYIQNINKEIHWNIMEHDLQNLVDYRLKKLLLKRCPRIRKCFELQYDFPTTE